MDIQLNETVTLTIETYEQMRDELKVLREQVKQKTIIKEVKPTWFELLPVILFFLVLFSIWGLTIWGF